MLFAGGTLAVVLVAALVIATTPRNRANPVAVSATTMPSPDDASGRPTIDAAARSIRLASFTAIPTAIAAVPGTADRSTRSAGTDTPTVLPDLDDQVLVVTPSVAWAVPWRDVAWLRVDGDASVLAADGSVVARFDDGRLVVSADALVGAAVAVDD